MVYVELKQRDKQILRAIVHMFILTGEPVPSNEISKIQKYRLSPASVRNIMAKLEQHGYLFRPHHSAGRMPTDLGYRFYVDMVRMRASFSKVGVDTMRSLLNRVGSNFPELFIESSRILSKLSSNIGVVLSPDISKIVFQHIDCMRLGYRKIMVVCIAKHGLLTNRIVEADEDYSQEELNRISAYLVNRMQGKTLVEVRDEIVTMMNDDRKAYDSMLRNAAMLAYRYFENDVGGQDLFLEGASTLFDKAEFMDSEKMKVLFKAFEEKNRIVKLLNLCIKAEGVNVTIGSENLYPEMSGCSVITSSYGFEQRPLGVVGIIGPKRMQYPKVISLVGHLSSLISAIIEGHEKKALL